MDRLRRSRRSGVHKFNAFSAPITEKLLADTLVVGPLSCMKRCKDNTQCEVRKLYPQLCIDFQWFSANNICHQYWKCNIQGYFHYSGYGVETCTLYSNIDNDKVKFTAFHDGKGGSFCRIEENDSLDDPSSFAGRKCETYDCYQP